MKTWKHDELQEDLAAHLRASTDRICWTNIQMGPSGTYRPDVFCMPKSYANFHPVVYEVKVSLSDFRSDITSGKWQNYLKVAQAVIFAMPAGFINKQDVPAGCGLIIRYETGWKMVKKPTMNALDTLPRDAWLKLLISGIEWEGSRRGQDVKQHWFNQYEAQKKLSQKFGDEIGKLLGDVISSKDRLQRAIISTEAAIQSELTRRQTQIEQISKHDEIYSDLKRQLCEVLGVDCSINPLQLQAKVRRFIEDLNKDDEIKRLNQALAYIQGAVNNTLSTDDKFKGIRKAA